jgi:hypothetical protein
MPDTTRVEVEGADTFARTLHGAADGLDDLDSATRQTGELVRSRAAGRAPKVSGDLARSLYAESTGVMVSVQSDLVYAPVIHYGWPAHNIRANPFLVPAAVDSQAVWLGYYERDVQSKLNKVRGT